MAASEHRLSFERPIYELEARLEKLNAKTEPTPEIRNEVRHLRRELVELILQLRGSPVTPRRSTTSSDMHYVELSHLLPRLVANVGGLVETYEAAGVCGNAEADALLARILADHRCHLAELEELQATASGTASEPRP